MAKALQLLTITGLMAFIAAMYAVIVLYVSPPFFGQILEDEAQEGWTSGILSCLFFASLICCGLYRKSRIIFNTSLIICVCFLCFSIPAAVFTDLFVLVTSNPPEDIRQAHLLSIVSDLTVQLVLVVIAMSVFMSRIISSEREE